MIHLVDDDEAVTDACRFLLAAMGYEVQCWNNSGAFLAQAGLHQEGVALLDMRMPPPDGHAIFAHLRRERSTLAVVFLTGHGDVGMAVEEMKLGAVDFLQKPVAQEPLRAAIARGYQHSRQRLETAQVRQRYASLTAKEKQVAGLVVSGSMNKDIADKLSVSLRTVEVHRARVMDKMAAASLAVLVSQLDKLRDDDAHPA
ncbi:tetrathionate respiration response regulator TtrR [[Enterobacter] lignolyticus]|uniref:Two component transcriptional regulator, LuxR family n=1 Tax=Enterobacter lignolyticus (strain SCF1) TaxID=701347 RepID=E3G623_ENTLS|nr:tetrathionate respiration response regulator TtrR [[Enterobacter] lignolyticus]ADO48404.1 two component transcriptional regulator, LuxR family [[Enterobacter] lignolyticus SCF1]